MSDMSEKNIKIVFIGKFVRKKIIEVMTAHGAITGKHILVSFLENKDDVCIVGTTEGCWVGFYRDPHGTLSMVTTQTKGLNLELAKKILNAHRRHTKS